MSDDFHSKQYHEEWLGYVQPIDGLMFSVPVLIDAQRWKTLKAEDSVAFKETLETTDPDGLHYYAPSLQQVFEEFLEHKHDTLLIPETELPENLYIYSPEGQQIVRPSFALLDALELRVPLAEGEKTPVSSAGKAFSLLAWEIPHGLDLDKPETTTGEWHYPPTHKFERLLRESRVPLGLLSNGDSVRFIYAPHGEATGSLTWHIADMATTDGRSILAAFYGFFSKQGWGLDPKTHVLSLLRESRERQTNVTEDLADQVYQAILALLQGFASADERQNTNELEKTLRERGETHIYTGLLTVLLRIVFILYAEERSLLPIDNEFYQKHLSLLRLFEELQDDAGKYPEAMSERRGAWPRLIALFRAVFFGAAHNDLDMPARAGSLFDPERFPFLEGWEGVGGAPHPHGLDADRASVTTPQIDDATVYQILEKLLVVKGERLSYRTLDVEQIGSVYERLMGYHVLQLQEAAVCMKPKAVWLFLSELKATPEARWTAFLKDNVQIPNAAAKRLSRELKKVKDDDDAMMDVLRTEAVKGLDTGVVGQFIIQPGDERRRTSSHYTPRSLTTKVVQKTLDPIMAALGEAPSSEDILNLKICDPAMGSGAFLVEACRYLGKRLEAAWNREGVAEEISGRVDSLENHARRMVAQRCLYGVDKNPMAVDLARVSLWLVTLSRSLPFTFVDHALRFGDSVVGLSNEQIRSFDWAPKNQPDMLAQVIDAAVDEALDLRLRILESADEEDLAAQQRKQNNLADAEHALNKARLVADVCIGAFFAEDKKKARESERQRRTDLVVQWLTEEEGSPAHQRAENELKALQQIIVEEHQPFHWMLEFPEVFSPRRRSPIATKDSENPSYMDAFVGNPPFGGKNTISAFSGPHMIPWLKEIHEDSHGLADYSAHFFRRCATLQGSHGTIGLIATNTIGQGETRSTGLQYLVRCGYEIYAAEANTNWPGVATVTISIPYLSIGLSIKHIGRDLDGIVVREINSFLRGKPERNDPVPLPQNHNKSYVGSCVLGLGFIRTTEEYNELVDTSLKNSERLYPYLGGEDVNRDPDQGSDRYIINFGQMSLREAQQWPDLMGLLISDVKAERLAKSDKGAREYWWQFLRSRPELYSKLVDLNRCLVTARVSKHVMFSFQPTNRVFNDKLVVFPSDRAVDLAIQQSRVHTTWAWAFSSTMRKSDINYSATTCFETFAFPRPTPEQERLLDELGERLQEERRAWTMGNQKGLTDLYNALKDPFERDLEVLALRQLHVDVDRAVLDAYGWAYIAVPPFEEYDEEDESPDAVETRKAQQEFEDEVMDRLYALNEERAKEERLALKDEKTAKKSTRSKTKNSAAKKKKNEEQGSLF